jgi:hypothetical protein
MLPRTEAEASKNFVNPYPEFPHKLSLGNPNDLETSKRPEKRDLKIKRSGKLKDPWETKRVVGAIGFEPMTSTV